VSRFFIERPILSNVIAIVTIVLGLVCLLRLPVAQYPEIVPPTIRVSTNYPHLNAGCGPDDNKALKSEHFLATRCIDV